MIKKKYVVENGVGHWEISNGNETVTCDDNELSEMMEEMSE